MNIPEFSEILLLAEEVAFEEQYGISLEEFDSYLAGDLEDPSARQRVERAIEEAEDLRLIANKAGEVVASVEPGGAFRLAVEAASNAKSQGADALRELIKTTDDPRTRQIATAFLEDVESAHIPQQFGPAELAQDSFLARLAAALNAAGQRLLNDAFILQRPAAQHLGSGLPPLRLDLDLSPEIGMFFVRPVIAISYTCTRRFATLTMQLPNFVQPDESTTLMLQIIHHYKTSAIRQEVELTPGVPSKPVRIPIDRFPIQVKLIITMLQDPSDA